jgi:aldose 1-epimerase
MRPASCLLRGALTALALLPAVGGAGDVRTYGDPGSGMTIVEIREGKTRVRICPDAGANAFSIQYDGRELLRQPPAIKDLPGFLYGNPLLYPTPNRVRDAKMTFRGKTYTFEPNNGKNFLHGLVHSARFTSRRIDLQPDQTSLTMQLAFEPGTDAYQRFPHRHRLEYTVTVKDGEVGFEYLVDNREGDGDVPFGFAIHPWFLYQGSRAGTRLTVPATHWMEAVELLPTGKLVPLADSALDARRGRSLEGFVIDDVFFGMSPARPAAIDFTEVGLRIEFPASKEFTHLVVYTPNEPWFCVENQTCSTDAHNLYERGLKTESNLQIVEQGKQAGGRVAFRIVPAGK